jgi:hypothetical protein
MVIWRGGICQCSVVVEPARQPTNSTRSAWATTARVAGTPPLVPTTPAFSGWLSARLPWPLTVVHTGALSWPARSARASQAEAITTPPPQMITGSERPPGARRLARRRPDRARCGRPAAVVPGWAQTSAGSSACFCTS